MYKYSAIILLSFILTACGTSVEPNFYSLNSIPGTATPDVVTVIEIQRPVLAGYLDRPDFVRQKNANQLIIDDSSNWAEPLDRMFARILAADLQQRLPASTVVTEENATPSDLHYIINMDIQRFNLVGGGEVLLEGQLFIADKTRQGPSKSIPIKLVGASSSSPDEVAIGLSRLVANMADQLSLNLKSTAK